MANPVASEPLTGKVAVITGAASGIGLALALEAARLGMKVALSDISDEKLAVSRGQVEALGVQAIAVKADVSRLADVEMLRERSETELGLPWLIVNNAGITQVALSWQHTEADWKRMIDINLYGVVNGLLTFLPGLRKRGCGYILNTASAAGLVTVPAAAAYVASKHAVVGLSETLYRELEASNSGIGVSVLCPALVKTSIIQSSGAAGAAGAMQSAHAMDPAEVARVVFDAIRARQFWILTHAAHMGPLIRARTEQIVTQSNPDPSSRDPDVAATSSKVTGVDFAFN